MQSFTARSVSVGLVIALSAIVSARLAHAQATVTWNGATDTTWSQPDTTSWTGTTYNSGDTAVFAGSGAGTVTIDAGGVTPGQTNVTAGSYTFSGGPLGGSGGIAKSGAGTLALTGSNSYSGTTSITAGVLNIQNASALGGTAAGTTVASGAALQIQGGITVTGESLSLVGGGIASDGALRNISGTNTWTGTIGIDGVGTIPTNRDVTPLQRIASDAGLLTLSGPMLIATPAGATEASHVLVQGAGNVVISGNISGGKAGNVSFTSSGNGAGTRTLSGSNTYLGWTQINGSLVAAGGNAIPDASRVVSQNNSGILVLNASETIGGLASAGAMQINLNSHTLTIGADNTTPLATDAGGATYLGTILGTGGIVKVGSGVLTLSASNSYSGGTTVSAGELSITHARALGATSGSLAVNGGTLRLNGVSATVGALSGSSGATITTNTSAGTATLTTSFASGTSTFGGTIENNGSGVVALTKSGAGTLTLSGGGANTATGMTTVNAGTLRLNKTAGVNAVGGDLTISGGGVRFDADNQITDAATVTMTGSASLLNSDSGGFSLRSTVETVANLAIDGGKFASGGVGSNWNITNSGSVTGGAGQTLFSINSAGSVRFGGLALTAMTGSVELTANFFGVFGNSPAGRTTLTVGAGGLTLDGSRLNLLGGINQLTALGSRLVLDGGVSTTGTASSTIGLGTWASGPGNGAGQVTVELSSTAGSVTRSFTIGGGGANLDVLLPITNGSATTAGIRKLGAGILTLGTANTYTGDTTIAAGTLALGLNGSFASSPTITIGDTGSAGAVLDLTTKTGTFAFTSGQTVGGIGSLRMESADTTQFAGTFAPGNSAGVFTLDGGTTLLSGTTQIEILGTARGTGYDAVDLVNAAVLNYGNGVLALDFGSTLASEQSYQLFGDGSQAIGGSLSSLTLNGANYAGLTFTRASGVWTSQGTSPANQTLTFTEATGTLVIVPEPGAIALAGLGVAMAAWAARRRRT